jgi:hypothetical protein
MSRDIKMKDKEPVVEHNARQAVRFVNGAIRAAHVRNYAEPKCQVQCITAGTGTGTEVEREPAKSLWPVAHRHTPMYHSISFSLLSH